MDFDPEETTIKHKTVDPCYASELSSIWEISKYVDCTDTDDKTKFSLIMNKPPKGFKFSPRRYQDKRKPGGFMNRNCKQDWFSDFDLISYSVYQDGLYSTSCMLFL